MQLYRFHIKQIYALHPMDGIRSADICLFSSITRVKVLLRAQHIRLLNEIVTEVLQMAKEHQSGRVPEKGTNVPTFTGLVWVGKSSTGF